MKANKNIVFLFATLIMLALSSCSYLKKDSDKNKKTSGDGYYSISGFLDDQWNLLHDQPILMLRVSNFNNHTDSAYISLDSALWENIRKQFDPSDISDEKFLNQYTFSTFMESTTNTVFLNYEANNKKLFTKSLYLGVDNSNNKIKSIFIQTAKRNMTYEQSQKLTYIPRKLISIQTFEKSIISKAENLQVTYYFDF